MSLRKFPTRTPALLAANRANPQRSTGPRTSEGKSRVALNALRHGLHSQNFLAALAKSSRAFKEFSGLYRALYLALLPDKKGMALLRRAAAHVWAMRRQVIRRAASRAEREAVFIRTGGAFPAPWQLRIKRSGWRVLVSVWVRQGRGRGHRRLLENAAGWEEGRARLHVGVTTSMRHPLLGYSSLDEVPQGVAPRVVVKTKPESVRKQKGNRNVIPIKDLDHFSPERRSGQRTNADPSAPLRAAFRPPAPAPAGSESHLPPRWERSRWCSFFLRTEYHAMLCALRNRGLHPRLWREYVTRRVPFPRASAHDQVLSRAAGTLSKANPPCLPKRCKNTSRTMTPSFVSRTIRQFRNVEMLQCQEGFPIGVGGRRMSHRLDLYRRWSLEMRKAHLFRPGERVGVAVSGGADSILLLDLMKQLASEIGLHLAVVHFNHQLRGAESVADEQFVRQRAESLGMEFIHGEADVAKVARERHRNLEATARELRYRFFFSAVNQGKVDKVVTAHTANDQAETVLLRLLRGSGAKGLGGIYPVLEGKVARPFLNLTRAEVEAELSRRKLDFRADSSNRDVRFLRNKVRAQLIPLLEGNYNPAIVPLLNELADRARDDEAYLERQAWERGHAWRIREGKDEKIPVSAFAQLPPSIGRRVLRQMMAAARGHLRGVTHTHVEALRRFALEGQSGRSLALRHDVVARKEFDWLIVGVPGPKTVATGFSYPVEVPGEVRIPELGLTLLFKIANSFQTGKGYNAAEGPNVDLSRLKGKLRVRNWRAGDRYQPVGSRMARKVKELFQKRKVPLAQRNFWPVLECGNLIVWVRGFPPDDRVAVSPETQRVVRIVEEPLKLGGSEAGGQDSGRTTM